MKRRASRDRALNAFGLSTLAMLSFNLFSTVVEASRIDTSVTLMRGYEVPDALSALGYALGATEAVTARLGMITALAAIIVVMVAWQAARRWHGAASIAFVILAATGILCTLRVTELDRFIGPAFAVLVPVLGLFVLRDGWSTLRLRRTEVAA